MPCGTLSPVEAFKPVFAPNLPVVVVDVFVMFNLGKEAFGSGTVAGLRLRLLYRNEIFSSRKNEDIVFVVGRDALGGLAAHARYAQTPAKPKGTNAITRAVDEIQFGLKAVATSRKSDRHAEVSRAGVQVGRERLANALQRASPLRKGYELVCGLYAHPAPRLCMRARKLVAGTSRTSGPYPRRLMSRFVRTRLTPIVNQARKQASALWLRPIPYRDSAFTSRATASGCLPDAHTDTAACNTRSGMVLTSTPSLLHIENVNAGNQW